MLSTVAAATAAALVHDETAPGAVRLVPVLTATMADDPAVLVLVDHAAAVAYLAAAGRAAGAARLATTDARLALAA